MEEQGKSQGTSKRRGDMQADDRPPTWPGEPRRHFSARRQVGFRPLEWTRPLLSRGRPGRQMFGVAATIAVVAAIAAAGAVAFVAVSAAPQKLTPVSTS